MKRRDLLGALGVAGAATAVSRSDDQLAAEARGQGQGKKPWPVRGAEAFELEGAGGVAFYEEMGRNFTRLVGVLDKRRNPRLTYRSKLYPGHTHTTVLAPAINDALLYLYGPHFPG